MASLPDDHIRAVNKNMGAPYPPCKMRGLAGFQNFPDLKLLSVRPKSY
jgi:hypothetical protein